MNLPRRLGSRPTRASSRFPGRLVFGSVGVLLLIWLGGATIDLLRVRADIEAGRDELTSLSVDRLGDGLVPTVDGAAARLVHADEIADGSPFLSSLAALPVVGRQVDALRNLTDATRRLGTVGRDAAHAIDTQLERAASEPAARLTLLDEVRDQLDRIEAETASLELTDGDGLVPPLRAARNLLAKELEEVPSRFDEARGHIDAVRALLAGPSRYLVLAANNAEMRGGAGMPLTSGVLTIANGDFEFGDFRSIANRHVRGVGDLVPRAYRSTYRNFKVGRSWLQTAVSPNFVVTGPIYEAMSAQFRTGPVDGVLEVDVVALRLLLSVIGPVELDGVSYTAQNIEQTVLNEVYLQTPRTRAANQDRRDLQGAIAAAIFEAIKTRDVEIGPLAKALKQAAAGRHLLAHSRDPGMQALWKNVGATGALPSIGLMVTVQSLSASKLDWYVNPRVTIQSRQQEDGEWLIRLAVAVPNPEREKPNTSVESFIRGFPEGHHRALVAVYLPKAATNIRSLDLDWSESGFDPPLQMVGKRIYIAPGTTETVTLEFNLPAEHIGALLLPSARVRPVRVTVNGTAITDAVPVPMRWQRPEPSDDVAAAPTLAAVLSLLGAVAVAVGTVARFRRRALHLPPMGAFVDRAPALGGVLYGAAVMVLVTAALIDATG